MISHRALSYIIAVILTMSCHESMMSGNPDLDSRFQSEGFIDVAEADSTIYVRLMYATDDNFTGAVLYDGLEKAYLHPKTAKALLRAQKSLKDLHPEYSLLIKDAARPMSVQRKMFRTVQGTPKANYVANPSKGGGLHNYGLAVDITIVDSNGNELPMGTPVVHLGPDANIDKESQLVTQGIISETERQNRLLLRRVMKDAGFTPLRTEWWHFNFVSKRQARMSYKLLDF